MRTERESRLREIATEVRKDVVRMLGVARSGRLASCLCLVDLLVFLYEEVLRVYPREPSHPERDRLVLSKGRGAPALYAVLARMGFFEREELWHFRRLGALLQAEPEFRRTPGVDAPGGALGMGLGIAEGMALALRMDNRPARVFCILGDGEAQEGAVWEAALSASIRGLSRLWGVVDANGAEEEGAWGAAKRIEALRDKFSAFGFAVREADGHDFASLRAAFLEPWETERPRAILARTRSGQGVTLAEMGERRDEDPLSRDEVDRALQGLEERREEEES